MSLFVGGTASHVGKSWFTTAFCRLLKQRGVHVAPFKAQNMSNNSFPCIEGGEIGRAQVVQAEACGLPPMADMNPVLLKPNSATGSQVVVQGSVWRNEVPASEYYTHSGYLMGKALESYRRLASQFEAIVCEGAGSVAEVNLYPRDITNLRFAESAGLPALLVADIERGGVFASLVGTMELLPPEHRKLVRAFAVNRFHGDRSLFNEGVRFLESRLGIPCLGVFPYSREILIDEEDSVSLPAPRDTGSDVAILRFPRISNFTDFRLIPEPCWLDRPVDRKFRVILLPGSKNTLADLEWLREQGFEPWLRAQQDALLLGICGGYQMLGERIDDVDGLGLLPVRTVMVSPKITRRVRGQGFDAYEIHMGRTTIHGSVESLFTLENGCPEGVRQGRIAGTYLHGALESPQVLGELLAIEPQPSPAKDVMYDRLSAWLVEHSNPSVLEALLR